MNSSAKCLNNDETIARIRNDSRYAETYLRKAFEGLDNDNGERVFLIALRHVVEARGGMALISEKTGLSRESLYRALSPKGNPTLKTMKKVVHATGLSFSSIA